jgi:hypothetical protein
MRPGKQEPSHEAGYPQVPPIIGQPPPHR